MNLNGVQIPTNVLEKYCNEKYKLFNTLSSNVLARSLDSIVNEKYSPDVPNPADIIPRGLTTCARLDHVINYVFREIPN